MKMYTVDQIEEDLNDLKLRIAKTNARRNAQINLLQKNLSNDSYRDIVYPRTNDILRRYYHKYLPYYYSPIGHSRKYPSLDDLSDKYYEPEDSSLRKSVGFSSEKSIPETYELLERKAQIDMLTKLKRFVLDQEREISRFGLKGISPLKTKSTLSSINDYSGKNSDLFKKNDPLFLNPINSKDNFYRRYNSLVSKILKPFRKKPSLPLKNNEAYKSRPSANFIESYRASKSPLIKPTYPKRYYPRITRSLSPLRSSLDDLSRPLYLKPWYLYSPTYNNLFSDYYYPPKSSKDIDSIIRDIEFENRRLYPYAKSTSILTEHSKYDPYESDSYIRPSLPTWKQYYYTQKLRSKPSNDRLLDAYDPYRDFFCDAASIDSDDILGASPQKHDSDTNSILADSVANYDNLDDWQIIDNYRNLIFEDIIQNLRKQQNKNYPRNNVTNFFRNTNKTRSAFYPSTVLKNDRSLYNYRIPDTDFNYNYSWRKKLDTADEPKKENIADYSKPTNISSPSKETSSVENRYSYLKSNSPTSTMLVKDTELKTNQYSSPTHIKSDKKFDFNDAYVSENKPDTVAPKPPRENTSPLRTNVSTLNKFNTSDVLQDVTNIKPNLEYSKINDTPVENTPVDTFQGKKLREQIESTNPPATNFSRRSSILETTRHLPSEQFNAGSSKPHSANQLSPKKQFSRPISPGNQAVVPVEQVNLTSPATLSRKNSVQYYPSRKGSIKTSSIEEESKITPKPELSRRYSIRDQSSSISKDILRNTVPHSLSEKRFSIASNTNKSFDEKQEAEIKEREGLEDYANYKDDMTLPAKDAVPPSLNYDDVPATKNYYQRSSNYPTENQYSRYPNQYPQFQNSENTNVRNYDDGNSGNVYYENEPAVRENAPAYRGTFSGNEPDRNPYEDQRYYDETQYDRKPQNTMYPSSYDNQYPNYDYNSQYQPNVEGLEKPNAPSYADGYDHTNVVYNEADYNPNKYSNNYQGTNDYYESNNAPSDQYNQSRPISTSQEYRENYRTNPNDYYYDPGPSYERPANDYREDPSQHKSYESPKKMSLENYSLNSSIERESNHPSYNENYDYSGQQSLENQLYGKNDMQPKGSEPRQPMQSSENEVPVVLEDDSSENPSISESRMSKKVEEERKKSVENTEAGAEPPPKETQRRISKAATSTAAEESKLAPSKTEKPQTERVRVTKPKPVESKFKRTASRQMKTIPKRL